MVTDEQYAMVVAENAQLRHEQAQLQQQVATRTTQVQTALGRIATLETQVAELDAKKTPPPSFVKANVPARPAKARAKRAAEHNHGRPRQEATQVVEHAITHCLECGSALGGVQVGRTRQVIEVPPPPAVQVSEHRMQRGWCSACRRWREAKLDLGGQVLGRRGRFGVGLAALVAHLRITLRLPLRTIQAYLADLHGLQLSVGALVRLLQQGADAAGPTVEQIRARARQRAVVHADETSWREAGRNGYAWLVATPEGERYVVYDHSRAGAVINDLLGEAFTGVLVSDFYAGYNDTPGGQHQRCWVHLLRDLRALREAYAADLTRQGLEVRSWVAAVLGLWQQIHRARAPGPRGRRLTPDQREAAADRFLLEVQALGAQFVEQRAHPCHALAWRLWHFQRELLVCVRRPDVPADNNAAERAIRPLVIARKISGGTRSPAGSRTHMTLYSLVATALASGLNPLTACQHVLAGPLPQV
jgi:transposase